MNYAFEGCKSKVLKTQRSIVYTLLLNAFISISAVNILQLFHIRVLNEKHEHL